MKRTLLSTAIAAIISLLTLTSCQQEPADLIVGTWKLSNINISTAGIAMDVSPEVAGMDYTLTFAADGTCLVNIIEDGESIGITAFYAVGKGGEADLIHFTIEDETTTVILTSLTDTTLVITTNEQEDGNEITTTMTFTRM